VQRCTVHKHRNLFAHAAERLHDEITADYDDMIYATTPEEIEVRRKDVERELVLRLASLLWRLRRATAIESGLFKIQAQHLPQFRQRRQAHQERREIIDSMFRNAVVTVDAKRKKEEVPTIVTDSQSSVETADQSEDLTRSFVRLSNLPTCPLDRLSRYESILRRQQACQILFTLRSVNRRKPWQK
jgi:hypothetical protein